MPFTRLYFFTQIFIDVLYTTEHAAKVGCNSNGEKMTGSKAGFFLYPQLNCRLTYSAAVLFHHSCAKIFSWHHSCKKWTHHVLVILLLF